MPHYRSGIGNQPLTRQGLALRGFDREAWAAGAGHSLRTPGSRGRCIARRSQPLSSQPTTSAPNSPRAPRPRPAAPKLERAGDLTDRLLRDYLSGWTSQYTEYDYYVPTDAVHGIVPEDIRGTLFLIGPALTEAYGTSVRHPSDGDGMVCSLAFGDGGQIFFRNRYVRTSSFLAEQAASRRLSRGIHDRGAAIAIGHHQQQQAPGHHHIHTNRHPHQQQPQQPQQQWSSLLLGAISDARRPSQPQQQQQLEGRAAAERTEFDDDFVEEASAAVIAAAAAAANAIPKQLRFDPLALLGLPPPPPLSALFNPLDLAFRAPANASVVHWGGRLLAFTEGGSLPYELNKLTLETVGLYDVSGAMADIGRLVGGYKIAPAPGSVSSSSSREGQPQQPQRLVLMGAAQSGPDALLRWVELGENGQPVGQVTTYRMPGALAQGLRDFWVTDRFYVVVQPRLDFNPERFATQAVLGAASFAECFDWDASRPSRIHLVPRPTPSPAPAPSASSRAVAAATSSSSGRGGSSPSRGRQPRVIGSSTPIVWPAKGPEAIVVDAPPLLPVSCIGCFSTNINPTIQPGGVPLVLDAICQQGLPGSSGGALDSLDPEEHRRQPKPELTRLVVDLQTRTATARVLSQRTTSAATTAAAMLGGGRASASAAAVAALAPVGSGGSFAGGYHHLYAAAAANDAADGWAPSQVLLKLALPPDHAVPSSAAAAAAAGSGVTTAAADHVVRRRGNGAEVWAPGDRVFVGPPVFVPRKASAAPDAAAGTAGPGGDAVEAATERTGAASPLPPLESEVAAAAARAAAAATARRFEDEQEGWLLVLVHDAESMTAELCILDARRVTHGPVAVIALPHHLPHARGAHFTKAYCGPGLAAPPGWRPRNAADGSR